MNPSPLFTVIVPTHKRAVLLERALKSIKSQQLDAGFEVIVISDAADPGTDQICATYLSTSDTYVRRGGIAGPSRSRNVGLMLARGLYVLFLDDDDAWHPHFLQQLQQHTQLLGKGPVYVDCSVVKERRPPEGPMFISELGVNLAGALTVDVYVKNRVHMSCFIFPRSLLSGLEFDESMRAYEDWEFLLSVFDRQLPAHLPIMGSQIFEVDDDTTDRRGSSQAAGDFNAVLDYIYVYRKHPAPGEQVKQLRANLIAQVGMPLPAEML